MDVAIVADTHIPDREEAIPESFRELISEADHVIHGGDFTVPESLETVRELASDLTAVHGNMDQDVDLPAVETLSVEGVDFVVTHGDVHPETGATVRDGEDWLDAVTAAAEEHGEEPRVGIGAHIHVLLDETHDGVRVVNPGSLTGADPADEPTMLTATVEDGDLEVEHHRA